MPAMLAPMTPSQMREDLVFLRDEWTLQDRSVSSVAGPAFAAVV
jgi:hypothetical protein